MGVSIGGSLGPVNVSVPLTSRKSNSGCLTYILLFFIAAWPYMLSTYVAVRFFGVDQDSTLRTVIGWTFEVPWLLFLLLLLIGAVKARSDKRNAARQRPRRTVARRP
jgi:Na+(H+)/acetate symporter ActP